MIVVVAILTYFIFFMLPYVHSHSIPEGDFALTAPDFTMHSLPDHLCISCHTILKWTDTIVRSPFKFGTLH